MPYHIAGDTLSAGLTYKAFIKILSNDPDERFTDVELSVYVAPASSIDDNLVEIPVALNLAQNYPNPFNPETVIKYSLPANEHVNLSIYNLLGQKITTLINEQHNAGFHSISWNGKNDTGTLVSSGVYIYQLTVGSKSIRKKMIYLR